MPRRTRAVNRTGFVDRLADDVENAAKRGLADRHRDRVARVADFVAAREAFGRVHRDGANRVLAEVLRDFENKARAVVRRLQRVQDRRQVAVELDVDDGADHLAYAALHVGGGFRAHVWPLLGRISA